MSKKPAPQSTQSAGGENQESKSYEKVMARWTKILGVSTVAVFIATGISAYFLFRTDETIKKQVEAAGIQLRAYVNFQQIVYAPHFAKDPDKPNSPEPGANVGVTWRNFGSTPAREMSYWISLKWYGSGTEPDFTKPQEKLSENSNITLGPGSEIASAGVFVPIADIQKISVTNGSIFFWGDAVYRDYIPDSPIRHSHFCLVAIGLSASADPGSSVFKVYKRECNYTD
ncbi:MAG TPA: hypothetical protein VH206_17295 [Xanthobacteraceae bacterium]|jgi:hypothetical protein|nr:hypothetical protein [Xanthobacteraceae bacterium]